VTGEQYHLLIRWLMVITAGVWLLVGHFVLVPLLAEVIR
jgi:hypothetical protein